MSEEENIEDFMRVEAIESACEPVALVAPSVLPSSPTRKTEAQASPNLLTSANMLQNEIKVAPVSDDLDDDEFEDETLLERLIGLTEMFPETVRTNALASASAVVGGIKKSYSLGRGLFWFIASSSVVCFFPLLLELERIQVEDQEATEHRTMMLGPQAVGAVPHVAGFQASVPMLSPIGS